METWITTGMYKQVWRAINAKGDSANFDWTIKTHADAVFLPERLVERKRKEESFRVLGESIGKAFSSKSILETLWPTSVRTEAKCPDDIALWSQLQVPSYLAEDI